MVGKKPVSIPNWLTSYIGSADLKKIEEAIAWAESKCSIEIVPMVVRRSSTVGHIPFMVFLLLSVFTLIGLWPFHGWVDSHHGDFWVPALLAFWFVLAFPISKLFWVQRILIPDVDEDRQARQRAWSEFVTSRISTQKNRRGILLFVSLMERKSVLLVDEGLLGNWSQDDLDGAALRFGKRLHSMNWGEAFKETMEEIVQKLEVEFPRTMGSHNEFENYLVIKE